MKWHGSMCALLPLDRSWRVSFGLEAGIDAHSCIKCILGLPEVNIHLPFSPALKKTQMRFSLVISLTAFAAMVAAAPASDYLLKRAETQKVGPAEDVDDDNSGSTYYNPHKDVKVLSFPCYITGRY